MLFATLRYRRPGRLRLAGSDLGLVLPLAAGRLVTGLVVLAAALTLTVAALLGSGGELPRRGLELAGQLASAAAGLVEQQPGDCSGEDRLLPLPQVGDESLGLVELPSRSWACDQPEVEPPG